VIASGQQPKSTPNRICAWRAALRRSVVVLMLCGSACFNTAAPSSGLGFKSFLGVKFGDSLRETRSYYPRGIDEASPMGYPAYHVTGLSSETISYPDVIYEFDGDSGMQVVVARFSPSSSDAVLERLRRLLGEPTEHTLTEDQRMAEAMWLTPGGEEIRFDRARHLMTVMGPNGGNMRKDVELRLENSAAIL
jgi:hypothetical protein